MKEGGRGPLTAFGGGEGAQSVTTFSEVFHSVSFLPFPFGPSPNVVVCLSGNSTGGVRTGGFSQRKTKGQQLKGKIVS